MLNFKKIGRSAVALFLVSASLAFVSCKQNPPAKPSDSGIDRYTDRGPAELIFPTKYIRTDSTEYLSSPAVLKISTREELESYTYNNESKFDFKHSSSSAGFYDAATGYNSDFFKNSSLVIIVVSEPSGSYSHDILGIDEADGKYTVKLGRFCPTEATDDIATWHIILEVGKDNRILDSDAVIEVSLSDIAMK